MTRISKLAFALMATMMFAGMQTSTADAAIRCDGAYQVFKHGGQHRSPLCEDRYLAQIARKYGMRVTAYAMHNSPYEKSQVCYTIGHDIRVNDICAGYLNDNGDSRKH